MCGLSVLCGPDSTVSSITAISMKTKIVAYYFGFLPWLMISSTAHYRKVLPSSDGERDGEDINFENMSSVKLQSCLHSESPFPPDPKHS